MRVILAVAATAAVVALVAVSAQADPSSRAPVHHHVVHHKTNHTQPTTPAGLGARPSITVTNHEPPPAPFPVFQPSPP